MRHSRRRDRTTPWLVALTVGALLAVTAHNELATSNSSPALQGGVDVAASDPVRPDSDRDTRRPDGPAETNSGAAAPSLPSCRVVIDRMPVRDRLAQLIYVGIDTTTSSEAVEAVHHHRVGGVFLRGNSTQPLVDGALQTLMAGAPIHPAVSVDDEGGRVQRIEALAGSMPSARVLARTLRPDQTRELARSRGASLRAVGVTMDFAPVLDISDGPDREAIGDRSFSPDPAVVTQYAGAFADGLRDSGILPVLKHFPGHGRASGDSHRGDVATPPIGELSTADLVPYVHLLDRAPVATMVGHMVVPGLTDGLPASLSPAAYQLLRQDYGFGGLAITDDLAGMQAITNRYDPATAALRALQAGADIALLSSGGRPAAVLDRLVSAAQSGELTTNRITDALRRALTAKSVCR